MMPLAEIILKLNPVSRFDLIDVDRLMHRQHGEKLRGFNHVLYCSNHTTAGYFEQGLIHRLGYDAGALRRFFRPFRHLFPKEAGYRHDELDLRTELTPEQRRSEPKNGDSHLTYIGAGLTNCVTYVNTPARPVYFIDLDGVNGTSRRCRQTTVLGFDRAVVCARVPFVVSAYSHPIEAVNLRDACPDLFKHLEALLAHYQIRKGRIDFRLASQEQHAALTVNEYETLLMQHDLAEVLHNPMQFMMRGHLPCEAQALPARARGYVLPVVNEVLDGARLPECLAGRWMRPCLSEPVLSLLRMKRSMSLLVSDRDTPGQGQVFQGRYQSPILMQWQQPPQGTRHLEATLVRFE